MKPRWIVLFAALALVALPVRGQVFTPQGLMASPEGQRKEGNYVWVWRSEIVTPSKVSKIVVSCPPGYVALSGGYEGVKNGYYGGFDLFANKPTTTFDGWLIVAGGTSPRGPTTMTVYATCVPPAT
jgi:hypothetical protein